MLRAYETILEAKSSDINGEIFNAGWENRSVSEIAHTVKNSIGEDVEIIKSKTDDNRSYHISSEKIKKILKFKTKFTIEDAVKDLCFAFDKKLLENTLTNDLYFNIKKMNQVKLK